MGMRHQWNPERENLAGEDRKPWSNTDEAINYAKASAFQTQGRYRDLLNVRSKLESEMAECQREIAQIERDMVSDPNG